MATQQATHSRKYIAIDLGATSGRVCVGTLTDQRILRIDEVHRFRNTPLQHNNHIFWDLPSLIDEIEQGLALVVATYQGCVSVACDSWALDHGFIDRTDQVLALPYCYRDSRTHNFFKDVSPFISPQEIFRRTASALIPFSSLGQLYTSMKDQPDIFDSADCFLFMCDLVHHHLCATRSCEISMAGASQLYSLHRGGWDFDLIRQVGLRESIFPRINPAGTVLGTLRPSIRSRLNLPGLQVVQSVCHDTAAAIAAAPLTSRNDLVISAGTWNMMGLAVDQPTDDPLALDHLCGTYPVPPNELFLLQGVMGLYLLECFLNEHPDIHLKTMLDVVVDEKPFQCLLQLDHPHFQGQPCFTTALRLWCQKTRQTYPSTEAGVIRSILESLALLTRQSLKALSKLADICCERIVIVGGGSRNRLLNQFIANATGLHVISGVPEATTAGNLLYQAVALGDLASPADIREITRNSFPEEIFLPVGRDQWNQAYDSYQTLKHRYAIAGIEK